MTLVDARPVIDIHPTVTTLDSLGLTLRRIPDIEQNIWNVFDDGKGWVGQIHLVGFRYCVVAHDGQRTVEYGILSALQSLKDAAKSRVAIKDVM